MYIQNDVRIENYDFCEDLCKILIEQLKFAETTQKRYLVVVPTEETIQQLLPNLAGVKIDSELEFENAGKNRYQYIRHSMTNGNHFLISAKTFNHATTTGEELRLYQDLGELGVSLMLTDEIPAIYNVCTNNCSVLGYTTLYVDCLVKNVKVIPNTQMPCAGEMGYAHVLAQTGRLLIHWNKALGVMNYPSFQFFESVVVLSHDFYHTGMRLVFDLCDVPYTIQEITSEQPMDWTKLSITKQKEYYTYDPFKGKNFSQWDMKAKQRRASMEVFRHLMGQFCQRVAKVNRTQFIWTSPRYYLTALQTDVYKEGYTDYPYPNNPNASALAYMRDSGNRLVDTAVFRSGGVKVDTNAITLRDFKLFAASTALRLGQRVYAFIPNQEIRAMVYCFVYEAKEKKRIANRKAIDHKYYLNAVKPRRESARKNTSKTLHRKENA